MAIEPNPRPHTPPEEKEVLKRVYQDQLRDLNPQLEAAKQARSDAAVDLRDASEAHEKAVSEAAWLQGRVDAIKMLAARDGITLD